MASVRDIKNRITSVQSTSQITKAMQMVSASKMQRAQDRALRTIPYTNGLYEIVNRIAGLKSFESPYLKQPEHVDSAAIVVVGTSRGFVGGLIANLTAATYRLKQTLLKKNPAMKISGISLHKTGQKILWNAGVDNTYHFATYLDAPTVTDLTPVLSLLTEKFASGAFQEIYLVSTHFVNTIIQKPVSKKILPLSLENIVKSEPETVPQQPKVIKDYIFEPDANSVLNKLLPEYFTMQIFTGVLESIASEHSARMVAMKNATDSAKELQTDLTLQYNRQRQASITQQIIEVINGSV